MPGGDIINVFKDLLGILFDGRAPDWILRTIAFLLLVWGTLFILSKIKGLWTEHFQPMLYDPEKKRLSLRRRRFADHIESEIRRLNNLEEWRDYRFTELEAEVEAEGRRRVFSLLPFLTRTRSGLRREKTLSKALEASRERLLLVEGDPGSGKSVALRHVAQSMARRAMNSRSTGSVIPIYINLKELERHGLAQELVLLTTATDNPGLETQTRSLSADSGQVPKPPQAQRPPIDKQLIQAFVLKSLNRANDRDIEEFLEEEFEPGLQAGTWLFLFDSFDELPEVLSSTEADQTIRNYSDAISDFLHGMNQCRGIIASRQFRGPGQSGWPRFRILSLSEERRRALIRQAELKPDTEKELIGELGTTGHEIRSMASNPLFLGLLCEHMRTGNPFPENAYNVFETYISTRLTRDKERLQRRFGLGPAEVRAAAESVAFSMGADVGLGLSPSRENIMDAMARLGLAVNGQFHTLLDALEYIKLARSETATTVGTSKSFTFAHRRFQEYFATRVVLQEPDRISSRQLLIDARWRETAVVLCQTQPAEVLSAIIEESRRILSEMTAGIRNLIEDPLKYVETSDANGDGEERDEAGEVSEVTLPEPFPWPAGLLHILSLLQAGFSSRLEELPDDIRLQAGRLILSASQTGTLSDRKWGLEAAGIVSQPILLWLLRDAFSSQSQWLKEVAYRQVARLDEIPADIALSIRRALVGLLGSGHLRRERYATRAHLTRLDQSAGFLSVLRLLLAIPFIDGGLYAIILSILVVGLFQGVPFPSPVNAVLITLLVFIYLTARRDWAYLLSRASGFKHLSRDSTSDHALNWALTRVFAVLYLLGFLVVFAMGEIDGTLKFLIPLLFWTPLAIFSARTGYFSRPIQWPLILLWPLFYIGHNSKAVFAWLQEKWLGLIAALLRGIPIFIGAMILSAFIAIPMILIGLIVMILRGFLWSRDMIHRGQWAHGRQTLMTGPEVLSRLGQYYHNTFRVELIKRIREGGELVATQDNELLLVTLARFIERDLKLLQQRGRVQQGLAKELGILKGMWRNTLETLRNLTQGLSWIFPKTHAEDSDNVLDSQVELLQLPAHSEDFKRWYIAYCRKDRYGLGRWSPELLDEISKLLEQVRAGRRDRD